MPEITTEWWIYLLLPLAGAVSGFVNAMAGAGSLVTLPALMLGGLDAGMANGSNRIAVLTQSLGSYISYRKRGVKGVPAISWLMVPIAAGAIAGAWLAVHTEARILQTVIGFIMLPMAALLFVQPGKWAKPYSEDATWNLGRPWIWVLLLAISFYGGFIQVGANFLILFVLVLLADMDLIHANALKLMMQLVFTICALPIYIFSGKVDWLFAILLSAGAVFGSWLGAAMAVKRGVKLVRIVMAICVVLFAIDLLWKNLA